MCPSFSVLIIDPNPARKEIILKAIRYQRLVPHVTSYCTLDAALQDIKSTRRTDVVFVSTSFPKHELTAFISSAKMEKNGRDGAYLLIFESADRASILRGFLLGIDGFIVPPFLAADIQSTLLMADQLKRKNLAQRVRSVAIQVIEILIGDLTNISGERFKGKAPTFTGCALEAAEILKSFNPDELEVYYSYLIASTTKLPPSIPSTSRGFESSSRHIEELIAGTTSPSALKRATSARSLMLIGKEAHSAIPFLIKMLSDQDAVCRHRARAALMAIAPTPEVAAMTDLHSRITIN